MKERLEGKKELQTARVSRLGIRKEVNNDQRDQSSLNQHKKLVYMKDHFKRIVKKNFEDYKENTSPKTLKKVKKVFVAPQERNRQSLKSSTNKKKNSPKGHSALTANEIATRAQALKNAPPLVGKPEVNPKN
ncbi:MAG: hypothetical protein CMM53_11990 [Rhodospirillaceae bacterium]|nr:hypothetical protein [Rhodospirillaceae bacterium]|tara:strand:- start:1202 stop:1597 length:396 start_codon:yes stop_codon:yes gene_type:complete